MTIVHIEEVTDDMIQSVRNCFTQFGGPEAIIKGKVFIKINASMPDRYAITSPEVLLAIIAVVKEANPKDIIVFDSSAVGFPTRVVFKFQDFDKRIRKAGAKPLYLDEERKTVLMEFKGKGLDKPVPLPRVLYDNLIVNKDQNTFINVPKLKTHLQTGMTCCIKNLHGLLYDEEKAYNHHHVDEKVVELYSKFTLDFNIVDAISVSNNGMATFLEDWEVPMNLLIAGIDGIAIDTVCSELIGIKDVKHLEYAKQLNLGISDLKQIEIVPTKKLLPQHKKQLNADYGNFTSRISDSYLFFSGKEHGGCKAGCKAIILYAYSFNKVAITKNLALIYGRGHDTKEFDKLKGPFIVNGPCAVDELKEYFENRSDRKEIKVYYVPEHFHITKYSAAVLKASNVKLKDMGSALEINPLKLLSGYIGAKMRRAIFTSMI